MKKTIFLAFFTVFFNIAAFSMDNNIDTIIDNIIINGKNISLFIETYSGDEILLTQLSQKNRDIIEKKIEGDTIIYDVKKNSSSYVYSTKVKLKLSIPQNMELHYFITTTSGDIVIDGVRGDIKVDNTNGKVLVKNTIGNLEISNTKKRIDLSNILGDININAKGSKILTDSTFGVLSAITSNNKITVKNASTIRNISTSNSKVYVDTLDVTFNSKVITNNNDITLYVPIEKNFDFSYFGDLIKIKNDFEPFEAAKFLIVGTSHGTIKIKCKKN